jgi:peptidoglycan/LPS O-acetylase OafA/YrhL
LAGVTWTLRYEWKFYAALLVLAFGARRPLDALLLPGVFLVLFIFCIHAYPINFPLNSFVKGNDIYAALFSIGMVCAAVKIRGFELKLPPLASSLMVLVLLVGVFVLFRDSYSAGGVLFLGGAFFLIIMGSDVFGILSMRSARRLGNASFGIYLLQGLVLWWVFAVPALRNYALASPLHYWAVIFFCAVLLIVFATFAHEFIERPFIKLGGVVGGWVSQKLAKPKDGLAAAE